MDFIKTSSLRALIELTFQRNWNGFIWMSRKGVIAKRVKAAPDGYIENQRPNAQSGWPRNECSALGQNRIRPTEVSAKVNRSADHATRPGKHCPAVGQDNVSRHAAHDQRASRETSLAAAQPVRVPRRCIRPSRERTSHVRPRNHRPNLYPRPVADHIRPTADRPIRSTTPDSTRDSDSGRPDRPSERRGRPEAVFEAQSAQFKPKAGADLARLGLAAFHT
ncbi:unnamed protein product [Microthlaspi erraticum]|uniref:Uncharacterized protein n=1 Tax=Microthlaspi erraticum TaxID=1685480 RepID=A0A6D2IR28_9BRAS|nr:unnamed protein product [Microthlaspi erraticum]